MKILSVITVIKKYCQESDVINESEGASEGEREAIGYLVDNHRKPFSHSGILEIVALDYNFTKSNHDSGRNFCSVGLRKSMKQILNSRFHKIPNIF